MSGDHREAARPEREGDGSSAAERLAAVEERLARALVACAARDAEIRRLRVELAQRDAELASTVPALAWAVDHARALPGQVTRAGWRAARHAFVRIRAHRPGRG